MIGSLANRSASVGIAVFPNLGYKKDAFLEPSLVVNILFPLTRYLPPFLPSTKPKFVISLHVFPTATVPTTRWCFWP